MISEDGGGLSTNGDGQNQPFESTLTKPRRAKIKVRWKEVESNTDDVPLTSYSDDVASDVATIQIEHTKAIRT